MSDVLAPALSELARIAEGLRSESATLRTELEIRSAQARVRRQLDEVLRVMRELPPESKKRLGQAANQVKAEVEDIVSAEILEVAPAKADGRLAFLLS